MFGKQLGRNDQIVAFILERDKIEVLNSRGGSKPNPRIPPLVRRPTNLKLHSKESTLAVQNRLFHSYYELRQAR